MGKVFYLLQDYGFFSCPRNTVGGYVAHIIGVVEAFNRLGSEVVIGAYDPVPHLDNHKVRYHLFKGNTFPLPKVLQKRQCVPAYGETLGRNRSSRAGAANPG